jgi:hypothetical protein
MHISIVVQVKVHVRSAPISPCGTTSRRTSAVPMVMIVNEKRPTRISFFVIGSRRRQTIITGIDSTKRSENISTERYLESSLMQSVKRSKAVLILKPSCCTRWLSSDRQYTVRVSRLYSRSAVDIPGHIRTNKWYVFLSRTLPVIRPNTAHKCSHCHEYNNPTPYFLAWYISLQIPEEGQEARFNRPETTDE